GCTLYHLLAGEPPFPEGAPLHKLLHHQTRQPRSLTERRGDVPAELAQVVERMLAKDPADRYPTPAEVARALVPFVEGDWPTVPIRKPAPGALPVPPSAPGVLPQGSVTRPKSETSRFAGRFWRWATVAAVLLVGVG